MDASPPADFKMIHAEFFFADTEFRFNGPASEGHSEQAAKCHAVLTHDDIGQKEFGLTRAFVASDDQRLAFTRQMFVGLTPDSQVRADSGIVGIKSRVRERRKLFVERALRRVRL